MLCHAYLELFNQDVVVMGLPHRLALLGIAFCEVSVCYVVKCVREHNKVCEVSVSCSEVCERIQQGL